MNERTNQEKRGGWRGFQDSANDPYLKSAIFLIEKKTRAVAKEWKTTAGSIHDKPVCLDMADEATREDLRRAGYKAHVYKTIPQVGVLHQHIRIDNPQNPNDPYILDGAWQQFQPLRRHKTGDPGIMIVKCSQLEPFLDAHGIEEEKSSVDENDPYFSYFQAPSPIYFGHLPWLATVDSEKLMIED